MYPKYFPNCVWKRRLVSSHAFLSLFKSDICSVEWIFLWVYGKLKFLVRISTKYLHVLTVLFAFSTPVILSKIQWEIEVTGGKYAGVKGETEKYEHRLVFAISEISVSEIEISIPEIAPSFSSSSNSETLTAISLVMFAFGLKEKMGMQMELFQKLLSFQNVFLVYEMLLSFLRSSTLANGKKDLTPLFL